MTTTRISPLMLLLLLLLILPLSVCINGCGGQYAENTDDKTTDTAEGNGVPSVPDTAALPSDPLSSAAYNDSPNRTSAGRFCEDISTGNILYRNVFDHDFLYQYDISSRTSTCLNADIYGVQFITIDPNGGKIFFSGYDSEKNRKKINIYSITKDNPTPVLEIENAQGAVVTDDYLYYHGMMDEFSYDISRKSITTGIVETLLPPGYFCSDVTLLVVGDSLYFHNLMDIFHLDTVSLDLTNITNGIHKNGLNKLQYADGYLYYYSYGKNAAIHRISAGNTDDRETVLLFNDGDFWYDNLLVVDNSLIFTGRQSSSLSEGEPEENFIRGTFKYSFQSGVVERIHEQSWGPACYVTHDYIVSIQNAEDKGADTILIMDYNGNDLSSSFPGLAH